MVKLGLNNSFKYTSSYFLKRKMEKEYNNGYHIHRRFFYTDSQHPSCGLAKCPALQSYFIKRPHVLDLIFTFSNWTETSVWSDHENPRIGSSKYICQVNIEI